MVNRIRLGTLFFYFLGAILMVGCTRKPLKTREQALRDSKAPSTVTDDLSVDSLLAATTREIKYFESNPSTILTFGARRVPGSLYGETLKRFASFLQTRPTPEQLGARVREEFDFMEVYGSERWGEVLLTSYYEPEIKGSLAPTSQYHYPLYAPPSDLIEVAISKYDDRFFDVGQMRGRLFAEKGSKKSRLIPYYTRREIDEGKVLKNRGLELCFVDPIDAFFAQIQGSLTVVTPDHQRLHLNYADQNGHRYQAIGAFLKDTIPLEQMTATKLEVHLRVIPKELAFDLMFKNPSYVFFQKREGLPQGSMGLEVTAGRTLAADGRFFPKGALTYLEFERPRFETPDSEEPKGFDRIGRLVFDQDSGGAIRGGGRIDLYWGTGREAKQAASVIRQTARLYYLAPKT